jgi:hypothetical protein
MKGGFAFDRILRWMLIGNPLWTTNRNAGSVPVSKK